LRGQRDSDVRVDELRRRGQDGRAAERLGFGVVLRNAERVEEDGESYVVEWTLELLDEVPTADAE